MARRLAEDIRDISEDELLNTVKHQEDPMVRCLLVFGYLTGGRVTELLAMRKRDFRKEVVGGKEFLIVRMIVLKKRTRRYRNVPINLERDRPMLNTVWKYCKNLKPKDRLIPRSRQWAWLKMRDLGIFPHYLRHMRATKLATKYDFEDRELVKFFDWADARMAGVYTHLKWTDVAKKL